MLYCTVKTGLKVDLADIGLNVLFDLVEYSAALDSHMLSKAGGKNINYSQPQSISDMTLKGKLRG